MRSGWLISMCVFALCLTACGDDKGGDDKAAAPPPSAADLPVVLTFAVDFERAMRMGHIPADADRRQVLERVAKVLQGRLGKVDVGPHLVRVVEDDRFEVRLKAMNEDRQAQVVRLATRKGTIEFFIEVLPDAQYRQADGEAPSRLRVWPGTEAEFDVFKKTELGVLLGAKGRGEPYTPTMPRFRLVPEAGFVGSADVSRYHVMEVPSEADTFDGRMLEQPSIGKSPQGLAVVNFEIAPSYQDAFESFTSRNKLLPLAIVYDGAWRVAPRIQAAIKTHLQIMVGTGSLAEREREARELVALLDAGAMPVEARLVSIDGS